MFACADLSEILGLDNRIGLCKNPPRDRLKRNALRAAG
jgi:hypothetical protein